MSSTAVPTPPPSRQGLSRVRSGLAPTLAHRLHFGWLMTVMSFFTVTMSPIVVIHSAFAPGARTFRKWMDPWARFILGLTGIRLQVQVRGEIPQPVVFVSNHQNAMDVPVLSTGIPVPFVFSAKKSLRSWPFVGWVLERTACLFIDRSGPKKALASLQEAAERIRGGTSVLLFPEGGRSWRHGLLPFMRGPFVLAIESGVPVVPVAIIGNAGVLDERGLYSASGEVQLILGEPISTEGLTRRDAHALSDRVEAWIRAELEAVAPLVPEEA